MSLDKDVPMVHNMSMLNGGHMKRCILKDGHFGKHMFIASDSAPILGDCLAKPVKHPFCTICGWRKGGVDSWDGERCKCGMSAPALEVDSYGRPLTEAEKATGTTWRRPPQEERL